jgi:hypothetical protein
MTRSPNPAETGEVRSENLLAPNLGLALPLAACVAAVIDGGAEEPAILEGVERAEEAIEVLLALETLFLVLAGNPLCRLDD